MMKMVTSGFFNTKTKPCENEFKQEYISRLKQRKNF